jgi:hypothetical protein
MKRLSVILVLILAFIPRVGTQGTTYTTTFPLTANPISESGRWINGQAVGLDWKDVRTTPGLASGLNSSTGVYDDSTALLTGTWGPNQTVIAAVRSVNQKSGNVYEEVEIRLRSAITAHVNTGYEVLFRCNHDGTRYTDIVRWNGPLGNFTSLSHVTSFPGIFDGDVVKATIVGNVITAYVNGVQVNQTADSRYANGNPGMGFFVDGGPVSLNSDFGFTSFTASDGGAAPSAPTNLHIIP